MNCSRLLRAAVEGVDDSAGHFDAAQVLEQQVRRAPHMDDDRQRRRRARSATARGRSIPGGHVGARVDRVDADLADGDEARIGARRKHRGAQARQIVVLRRSLEPERMQPERIGETVALRQSREPWRFVDVAGRHHQHRDARRTRARHDVFAVRIELVRVQVAMRVDPH